MKIRLDMETQPSGERTATITADDGYIALSIADARALARLIDVELGVPIAWIDGDPIYRDDPRVEEQPDGNMFLQLLGDSLDDPDYGEDADDDPATSSDSYDRAFSVVAGSSINPVAAQMLYQAYHAWYTPSPGAEAAFKSLNQAARDWLALDDGKSNASRIQAVAKDDAWHGRPAGQIRYCVPCMAWLTVPCTHFKGDPPSGMILELADGQSLHDPGEGYER